MSKIKVISQESAINGDKIWVSFDRGKINVNFITMLKKEGDDGYSCLLPGFDLVFSAPTKDEIDRRSSVMMHAFLDYWVLNQGWSKFIKHMNELGFRAPLHALKMKELLERRPIKTKMTAHNMHSIPDDFSTAEVSEHEFEVAM
jgi:hypothetical protein